MGTGDRFTPRTSPPTDAFSRGLSGVILPIALLAALVIILYPLRDDLNTGTIALVLLLPPLLATIGGLRVAMAMAVVGALTFNFFFTEPYNSFQIEASESVAAFVIYLLVAFVVALFASRVRDGERAADERAAQAAFLQQATVEMLTADHALPGVRSSLEGLRTQLGLDGLRVTGQSPEGPVDETAGVMPGRAAAGIPTVHARLDVTTVRPLEPDEQRLVESWAAVAQLALDRATVPSLRTR